MSNNGPNQLFCYIIIVYVNVFISIFVAIEGIGGVPPIRPLETLHNALSLRQLDAFLEKMITAPLFRTPASSPPKYPSTPLPTPTGSSYVQSNTSLQARVSSHPPPLGLQSPSNSKLEPSSSD